jgi:pimeloyl-ACP methyl ester carboxylesterase
MGVSYPLPARAWAAFKASIFTPLNGWQFYLNNRRLMRAERFWSWIISDHTLSTKLCRVSLPVLLIYGERDLIAPPEIGRAIYARIGTPPTHKTMLVLPNSRHGAEGRDIPRMQQAIQQWIGKVLATSNHERN